ncbi:MAG: molybdopterin-dependent oxidoreductase [Gammaproteobacteria bacterium]|nr:molybdopterin-dependent oxidoreductase [Gammaproteobacteria bacterium]
MTTRRDFLKLGGVTATATMTGGVALSQARELKSGGADYSPESGTQRKPVPTACWQCVSRCSVIGYVENDRLVKIGGQPESIRSKGKLCAKAQAGVNHVYDPDRILYPMKRVGKRGEGKWKRISWDEALTEVSSRLKKLRDDGHPEKFMFHYGRMKASSSKLIKDVFLSTYGTGTIGNHTSICEGGKWTAQELTWGSHYDNWDFDNTRYIINFGSNCLETHTNHVSVAHRLVDALVANRVKMVTFDVRLSNTAAKSSEWVPIKAGTDGAVALAMCHVIINEELYKGDGEAFLEYCKVTADRNASTAEKVAALKLHLAGYTPQWAESLSGVSASNIEKIARELATTKPACVVSYRGTVAHYNGNDAERAMQMLAAITGNIDNPGGRCRAVGASWNYPKGPKNKPGSKKLKIVDGFKGQAAIPTHHVSHQVLKMIKDGSAGRPDVYMWYCYQPVYSNGDVQENIDILKDENLIPYTVAVSPFYDESSALADIILPDATYLERWDCEDMVSPAQIAEYYLRQPTVKPLGEVRDFGDVCCDLAERMGFPLGYKTKEEYVRETCENTPGVREAGGFEYMRQHGVWHDPSAKPSFYSHKKEIKQAALEKDGVIFDQATGVYWNWKKTGASSAAEAMDKGFVKTSKAFKGYVGQLINGKVYRGFPPDAVNKSGYFELYSELMEAKGFPPLPTYTPIPEHQEMQAGDLVLTTYKVNVHTHSRTQNCKWLTEIYHQNPGWINPQTAANLGISDGDLIKVKSKVGELETKALVTPAIVPGQIAISFHCGHWEYGRYASGNRPPENTDDTDLEAKWWTENGAHPNWIIPNDPDPINGQQRWMDTVVQVTRA